ncbi:MAG: hypothetical protein IPK20_21725 [Betaproteobacteria bacterium]|nr:hypothetical protein [Betaproteobacteria bacterium]
MVLLDIGMPGLNGYEVARSHVPETTAGHGMTIVALTGWGQERDTQP